MNRPIIPPRIVPRPPPERIKIDKSPPDLKRDIDGLAQLDQQSNKGGEGDNAELFAQASEGKARFASTCTDEFLENLGISSYRPGYPLGF